MPPKVIVICGPTASGKTALAVETALAHNGEVVSADSMQLYRGMDVGTAKPTEKEKKGVPHHMLDVADPSEDFSVARYVDMASRCVDDVLARGKLPIIAGGTGLYIDSLLKGLTFAPFTGGYRERLRERAGTEGIKALHEELRRVDPDRADRLHPADEKRILRALEVFYETGETITRHDERTQALPPRYEALRIGLNFTDRDALWSRIDLRVDKMLSEGLENEVRALLDAGVPSACTAMQAIGYKEFVSALRGERTVAEAAEEVKLRSRQYAKRQLTWFRRDASVRWILWEKSPDMTFARQNATAYMEEFGIR
ncbi:MAG: tRNA (adenosine(37)-N6)-dimethylallyltransferase MiaA [Clostridia bacterium]|nr:tRNA (adenosine(37)-N6)-dimethylallyltransferase MiaA [Clostridia bacterium]